MRGLDPGCFPCSPRFNSVPICKARALLLDSLRWRRWCCTQSRSPGAEIAFKESRRRCCPAAAVASAAFVSSFSFSCELFQFAGEVLPKILGIERRGGKKGNSGTPLKVECCDSGCSFPGKRFAARTSPAVAVVVVVDGEGGRGKDRDTCGEALLIHGLRHYHCLLQDGNGKGRCVRRKRDFNSLSPPSFRSPSPAVSSPLYLLVPCLHASEHALLGVLRRFPQCRQPCAFGEKRDRFIMFAGRL